jgi:putative ABC transport system permease protein
MKYNKFWRDVLLGVENLLLHKLRSFLTMLGVVFGVGSVVAMLSVGEGASKEALEQIRKVGSNNIIIDSMKSVEEETETNQRGPRMSIYGLTYEDRERIARTFPDIKQTVPVKLIREKAYLAERSLEIRVVGTTLAWFDIVKRPLLAGRILSPSDFEEHSAVVVLTEYGARRLLATKNTIGENLRIGTDNFMIVGIVKSEGGKAADLQLPDQEVDAYIPINIAKTYYGDITRDGTDSREMKQVELDQVILEVEDLEHVDAVAKGIEVMLERFHAKKDYVVRVPLALLKQAKATKRTFNIVFASIAGISLLVGGIGIMNIMLASVTERTREIGIRRAIGAKRKQIITQFLIETVVLSTMGGIVGLGLGIFIQLVITLTAGMPTGVTPFIVMVPLIISIGIGIFFGFYPAFRAAEVDPIIALRHE